MTRPGFDAAARANSARIARATVVVGRAQESARLAGVRPPPLPDPDAHTSEAQRARAKRARDKAEREREQLTRKGNGVSLYRAERARRRAAAIAAGLLDDESPDAVASADPRKRPAPAWLAGAREQLEAMAVTAAGSLGIGRPPNKAKRLGPIKILPARDE